MIRVVAIPIGAIVLGAMACSGPSDSRPTGPITPGTATPRPAASARTELPPPSASGPVSLEEALAARRSIRDFTEESLEIGQLSQLLWATQGITAEWGGRTAPSAGALYPLEIYVSTQESFSRYVPEDHRLEAITDTDLRPELAAAALGQDPVADAPAVFVIAAVPERTEVKYGGRALRYVHLEAGHACQNLLLQAVALGLGAVPIGAFDDDRVRAVLELPADQLPLYLVPVGYPA